jgi:hypothetical protein
VRVLGRLLVAVALAWPLGAGAQPLEQEVKAAYLFRFLSFVEWPAQALPRPGDPIMIGVMAADEVLAELEGIVPGRSAQNRPVAVRQLKPGEAASGLHAIFVGRSATSQIPALARLPGVLLVSESEGALELGSMINLVRVDGRVRFEAAPDHAERRGLRLSSRLLTVAQYVRPARP